MKIAYSLTPLDDRERTALYGERHDFTKLPQFPDARDRCEYEAEMGRQGRLTSESVRRMLELRYAKRDAN